MAKTAGISAPAPADPDFGLLRRIAGQDEDALEALYQQYGPGLLAYLFGRLGDIRLAEDVLQEVMLAVWRNAPRFRGECRVRTWLLTIARSRSINAYHRESKFAALEAPFSDPPAEKTAELPAVDADLQTALDALPEDQRETLDLVFYHGLSLQETALVQKVALGTVKSRLHRAKANLREWYRAENERDDHA